MCAWCASTISRSRWNEAQADARVRRHRFLRLGRAAGSAHGRGRGGPGARRGLPDGGTSRGRRVVPTPVCTRSDRSRASTSREGRRPITPPRRSTPSYRMTSPSSRWRRRRRISTPGIRPADGAIATASGAGEHPRRSSTGAATGIRGGSTRRSSATLRTPSSGSTTSAPSRRPRRSTRSFTRVVLAAAWHRRGDSLEFEITADSFLRHMVRTLVGTMLERTPDEVAALLDGEAAVRGRPHGAAVGPVPRERALLDDLVRTGGRDGEAVLRLVLARRGRGRERARHPAGPPGRTRLLHFGVRRVRKGARIA